MNEHESGPLDDSPEALHRAVTALQRKRAFKRELAKSEVSIRSGTCPGCDHFTTILACGYCDRCSEEVHAPVEPVSFAPKPTEVVRIPPTPSRYWRGFTHGAILTLALVVGITAVLLIWGLP